MYLFFDVETTGISKSSDILEFAAIECSDDLRIQRVINNYYFYDDEVPSGASKVNGLTRQKLEFLADTDFMSDAKNIHEIFSRPQLKIVGHNVISYDLPVVKSNLHRAGFELNVSNEQCIDTLLMAREHFKGKHDLTSTISQVLSENGMTLNDIQRQFESSEIIKPYIKDKKMTFHSGLFDAFVTFVIYVAWNT